MKKNISSLLLLTLIFALTGCEDNPTESEELSGKAYYMAVGNDNELYITTNKGLFKSPDNGNTWHNVNSYACNLISLSPSGDLYCMRYESDGQYTKRETLWISTDGGKTFSATAWVRNKTIDRMLWINFNAQEHLFALQGGILGNGLHRSTTYGQNWDYLLSNVKCLVAPNNIYASIGGISRSIDNGDSWNSVLSMEDTTGDINYSYPALAFNSQGRIFAAVNIHNLNTADTTGKVCYSDDEGNSWASTIISNCGIDFMAVNSEDKIFSITDSHQIIYSTDNGVHWDTIVSTNLPTGGVQQFMISPVGKLFIRTWNNVDYKLFRSQNNGINWEQIWPQ